jgi:two-component system, chemotaxis family, CheB/CheR fusion protein
LLSDAGWTEASLREVILTELTPYGAHVTVNEPPVMLKPQAALFLALVVHELATNAAKYGSLSTSGGRVEITWTIEGDPPTLLEWTWTERGGPQVDDLPTRGFGTELIERGMRFELQGEATLDAVAGGLQCRIKIPTNPRYINLGSPPDGPIREEAAS